MFLLTPDLTFCACYATISLTQIGVLLLQARLGSRFFIPRRLRPKPFDYYLDETSENYIVYKDEVNFLMIDMMSDVICLKRTHARFAFRNTLISLKEAMIN